MENTFIKETKTVVGSPTETLSRAQTEDTLTTDQDTVKTHAVQDTRPVLLIAIIRGAWDKPQQHIVELAEHFRDSYHVHVVCGTYEFTGTNEFQHALEGLGVEVHTIDALQHKNVLGNEFVAWYRLWKLCHKLKPSVVHVHDAKTSFLLGFVKKMGHSFRLVATMHELLDTRNSQPYEASIAQSVVNFSYSLSEVVMVRNQYVYLQTKQALGERGKLVLPGLIDRDFCDPQDKRRSLVQDAADTIGQHLEDPATLVIGSVAPLKVDRGIVYTLQALSVLQERGVPFVYVHYGEGNQEHLLDRQVEQFDLKGRVLFNGRDTRAWNYLSLFDVVVVPTLRDGDVELLREAAQTRRAVVTTDVSGVSDTVASGVHALVVPQKDPNALADAMERLCLDPVLRNNLGDSLKVTMSELYNTQIMFEQTEAVYKAR